MKYVTPQSGVKSFTCPHCGVLARQYHFYSSYKNVNYGSLGFSSNTWTDNIRTFPSKYFPIRYSICEHCENICLWHHDQMVYPNRGNAPVPNPDMPEAVKKDYEEAASIYTQSPKGAAALLRLAIQKLSVALGGEGKNINNDIKELVKKGLPEKVQKSLDVVRVIGNNAVHPGQIDTDNPEVAGNLFILVNVITEYMISMPKKIDDMYSNIPPEAKEAIDKRDGK
jgi:hypothetical protein